MVVKLTEQEKAFIIENLEDGARLVETGKLNDILIPLDEWIALHGFDDVYDLTDEGRRVQRMYDNIYLNNI